MGNLKTFFLACLGLGIAAGAGFYLYRKFTSTDGEEENSATQVTAIKVTKEVHKSESEFKNEIQQLEFVTTRITRPKKQWFARSFFARLHLTD